MRSRPPQIYVHVGPPKTATTYIQDTLWGNRAALSEQGIQLVGRKAFDHYLAAMDIRGRAVGGYSDPRIPGSWDSLVAASQRLRSDKGLISHEFFAGLRKPQVAKLVADLGDAEVHVIFTARDLGRQLPAVWQEGLKNRSTVTFDTFLDRLVGPERGERRAQAFWRAHDPLMVLRRWAAVLPPEQVHVLTAPAIGVTGTDLWSRFASVLGADSSKLDLTVARRNASLSRAEAEVLRQVNLQLPDDMEWPSYQRLVQSRFNFLANQQPRGERILIPGRFRAQIQKEAVRVQKGLADARYDLVGDVSDLEVVDEEFGADDVVAADQVTAAATALLTHVLTKPVMENRRAVSETSAQRRRRQASERYHDATAKVRRLLRRS